MRNGLVQLAIVASLATGLGGRGLAQELEPGLYQNAPLGQNSVTANYTFSTGNVLFDASLPVEGAQADLHSVGLGYLRTVGLFGRSAKIDVQVPVAWGTFEGYLAGAYRTRSPSGLADPRIRLAVNLLGAPALDLPQFTSYRQRTILGASLQIAAPLGQYDPTKLINLGANRWSFRPEVGLSHARGRWFLELIGGAWLFTENADYFGGSSLTQEPLYFVKTDVIYTIKRRLWASANYGLATGGETSVDGAPASNLQTNNRLGLTLALPVGRATSLKIIYTSGLTTRLGADFDSFGAGFQYGWGGRRRGQAP